MQTFVQMSDLTATGDTTKTKIGTITLSARARKITGFCCYAAAAAIITSGEPISGVVEFESSDFPNGLQPMQLPLDVVDCLTSGATSYTPRFFPVQIPCRGQEKVDVYVTMDMAMTGALKARGFIVTEGE